MRCPSLTQTMLIECMLMILLFISVFWDIPYILLRLSCTIAGCVWLCNFPYWKFNRSISGHCMEERVFTLIFDNDKTWASYSLFWGNILIPIYTCAVLQIFIIIYVFLDSFLYKTELKYSLSMVALKWLC